MSIGAAVARTLQQPAVLSGVGLHSGRRSTVRLCPAAAGTGIVFVRTDLPGRPVVSVRDFEGAAAPFRTAIKKGAAEVHTVEHILSALVGLAITDCRIEIDEAEVPGMDGSALDFVHAVRQAGIRECAGTRAEPLVVGEPVHVEDGMASIEALPYDGGLKITYTLDYAGHPLAQGSYEIELDAESYAREIAPARTFVLKKDAETMRAAGLGKGADYQNTVVIDGDRALETSLRFANEPVRHKILDLLGDLCLLGCTLQAHVVARCSGHRANRALVLRLRECAGQPATCDIAAREAGATARTASHDH
ncbi:MAG: UDP-3-O-acyl-N-acetylglucosamine deacetylase [Planctomycetota bacterium]|nr:UDP-3-O-acyl-N-acetylglucosamine deacetylase [Planctomycetota bacterium]